MERERPLKGVSNARTPWIKGNIKLTFGSDEMGRLSSTENSVSAATNPLMLLVN